jgi:hypothetical protein
MTDFTLTDKVHSATLTGSNSTGALNINARGGALCAVQATGTWGGGTITVQVSLDGTNWFTAQTLAQADATFSSDGLLELSTAAAYLRVTASSVTSVAVSVVLRN